MGRVELTFKGLSNERIPSNLQIDIRKINENLEN